MISWQRFVDIVGKRCRELAFCFCSVNLALVLDYSTWSVAAVAGPHLGNSIAALETSRQLPDLHIWAQSYFRFAVCLES